MENFEVSFEISYLNRFAANLNLNLCFELGCLD
jgi:hypothetical protein